MEVAVLNKAGQETGRKIVLEESIFAIEANDHAIYLDVKQYLANKRQGTHKSKERWEVAYSTKKIKRQKGTGGARAGSIKSPLFVGGGVIFGPKPRDYSFSIPQKARKLALKSALSARSEKLIVVKDFSEITEPKTKLMVKALSSLKVEGKTLIIADTKAAENQFLELAARNIPSVRMILPTNLNVKDLLEADFVVITESAINEITERLMK